MLTNRIFVSLAVSLILAPSSSYSEPRYAQTIKVDCGTPVKKNELPYHVSVRLNGMHICMGTIVNDEYILTAAHCAELGSWSTYTVVAGQHDRTTEHGSEQTRQISKIITHQDYDSFTLFNDISLLKLNLHLDFNEAVQPIPLAPKGHRATGNALVSGWGLRSGTPSQDILYKLMIPVWNDEDCRDALGLGASEFSESMICAGRVEGGCDFCNSDSAGGPLVAFDLEFPYLAGIISWGYGCGLPNKPGVYTEVAVFADWVNLNIE